MRFRRFIRQVTVQPLGVPLKEYKILREIENPSDQNSRERLEAKMNELVKLGWSLATFGASVGAAGADQPYWSTAIFYALMQRDVSHM